MVALARSGWLRLAFGLSTLSTVIADKVCYGRKQFELTLTVGKWAPDGVEREMILVNGAFPAPTIEVNQGDYVDVIVHNKMAHNTTVHFHGMFPKVRPDCRGHD